MNKFKRVMVRAAAVVSLAVGEMAFNFSRQLFEMEGNVGEIPYETDLINPIRLTMVELQNEYHQLRSGVIAVTQNKISVTDLAIQFADFDMLPVKLPYPSNGGETFSIGFVKLKGEDLHVRVSRWKEFIRLSAAPAQPGFSPA